MPGTVFDDVELIDAGRGGGTPPPAGGDGDGDGHGSRRPFPRRAYFTALQLGLAAIVMFFMAMASSYIVRRGLGTDWQRTPIPPVLWFNTAVLLTSSVTIIVARKKLASGEREVFQSLWWVTTGLGILFLAGQIVAWRQLAAAGMLLATNPSSSFFYVLTAAHGAHLAGGIFFLFYVAFRPWRKSRISQETAAELASIYWHFMDGLWIFLLALL
ncbi:MAG TPA: cytochrome c oxidase subunit 3, partial [Candidatus Acidoferrales bacterium]|nr:cytochrome c oxidase subunit 3 [Candidatus Acidoferrales bacterium]